MWNPYGWQPTPAERWCTTSQAGTGSESFMASGRPRSAGNERIGHSTSKVPPCWEPSFEVRGYPFWVWLQDLDVWAAGTELQQEQQAPAVVQRLGGAARDLARGVPTTQLRDGRTDAITGVITTGQTMLVQGLEQRFGQFSIETSTRVIIDLLGFRRRQAEFIVLALLVIIDV